MDDESDRSSEATQVEDVLTREDQRYEDEDIHTDGQGCGDDDEDEDQNENDDMVYDDDDDTDELEESSPMPVQEDSRTSQSETLVSGLADVPIQYAMRQDELEKLKNQLQGSHQEALAIVIAQAAQAHSENQFQLPGVPSSSSQLTPISVPPVSILPSSNSQGQILSPVVREKKNASDPKTVSSSRTVKTPIDGFNWRKYGQKQVKSPQGSRSYYKCTHPECDAKKIESCDQNDSITKIVYKGQHNHDPPKKVFSRGGKTVSARRKSITAGSKRLKSSSSVDNGSIQIEEVDAPEPKPRVKKSNSASPGSVLKRPKKPKFVVHAPADVGISADGYRWRKYGQKMVKGNPHPRNYYKCTSAGCPVRKHIEMAIDGSEVIITYKGVHDHDMPVPKKSQGSPSGLLTTATTSASNDDSQPKKRKTISNEVSATEVLDDVAQNKGDDSCRTLLSVGFEIKPC